MSLLPALLRREFALAWSGGGGPALALGFYAAVTALVPLAGGPFAVRSGSAATGIAWIGLLLANLLTLDRLFAADHEDGALELLALAPAPLEAVAAVKCLAHWLAVGAPLALAAPLAAIALGMPPTATPLVALASLIGALAFAFVGGVGAALALSSRRGGLLIAAIVLPLLAPPIIFGGGATGAFLAGRSATGGLAFLTAYALAAAALAPFAMAGACRAALE